MEAVMSLQGDVKENEQGVPLEEIVYAEDPPPEPSGNHNSI